MAKSGTNATALALFTVILHGVANLPQASGAGGPGPSASAQFERYVQLTEKRMAGELFPGAGGAFLWHDALPPEIRSREEALLRSGEVITERLQTRDGDLEIVTPGALVHHWVGEIFIPGASLDEVMAVVQDYDRHEKFYAPQVLKSKLISRNGDDFKIYLRLKQTDVVTVVFDTEHEVHYARLDATHAYSRSYSTQVTEIEHAGEPKERPLAAGEDHGLLWRIDSFWRFEQRDGGVYVQCEAISLSRDVPFGLGALVGPFLETIPKESLEFTLRATRDAVAGTNVH
jgi:hypothetical protein